MYRIDAQLGGESAHKKTDRRTEFLIIELFSEILIFDLFGGAWVGFGHISYRPYIAIVLDCKPPFKFQWVL